MGFVGELGCTWGEEKGEILLDKLPMVTPTVDSKDPVSTRPVMLKPLSKFEVSKQPAFAAH